MMYFNLCFICSKINKTHHFTLDLLLPVHVPQLVADGFPPPVVYGSAAFLEKYPRRTPWTTGTFPKWYDGTRFGLYF